MTIYLDTNVLVYLVETIPGWAQISEARIDLLRRPDELLWLGLSDLSRMECRVGPLKRRNALVLQDYGDFFRKSNVRIVPLSTAVYDLAAEIRAQYGFSTTDAIHLAAAVEAGSDAFLTNDTQLGSFRGLPVEVLS